MWYPSTLGGSDEIPDLAAGAVLGKDEMR